MDDSMAESGFEDGVSSDFEPQPKTKAKPGPKPGAKKAVAASNPKAAPKKTTQTTLKTKAPASKKRSKPDSDEENSDNDADSIDDASLLSQTPPKKQKKDPAPKKSSGKPLQPLENESFNMGLDGTDDAPKTKGKAKNTASDQYQRLTQLEHILKRPDTYIGSVEHDRKQMWVFNSDTESMELRDVSFVPGLYKIFDEILVNAADNKQRDKNMSEIRVTIDRASGVISVKNNGKGIPIEIHEKEQIFIPELIFGHLLTSSNYDDEEQKVTGGRNGYGAKLCNVFSTEFTLETADNKNGKKYKQVWTQNMSKMDKARITAFKGDDYTQVTFHPDFVKFGMTGIDDDFEAIAKRRVYDMAGTCKGVKVFLNGERVKVPKFKDYMVMYTKALKAESLMASGDAEGDGSVGKEVILTDAPNDRWEVGFAVSDGSFQQVSFVNSIATTSGGTHVNYVADQIVDHLAAVVKKKNKGGVLLKPAQIRNHMFIFVNCLIVNPAFTSQTKEQLTTKASQFGSKCPLSDKFLKAIEKSGVVDNIMDFAQKKADSMLKKSDGNKRTRMNNTKLVDANKAGTKDGHRCTLILTEGDSAALLAIAGRAEVSPDLFGVFPLRGKMLNVRDASIDQIAKNAEIQNIKKFLGLQHKKEYTDTRGLRYGHLMIMTDQDHDGSHIKGLLINFLQVQYPSLLKIEGFLLEFITPIVKVWKGDPKHPRQLQSFFTMPEYEAWRREPGHEKGWDHKYYKGLGTSSPSDAIIYFRDLDKHLKEFHTMKENEVELIDLAFSKKKADARKNWLREFQPGTYLDMSAKKISYDEFINKELILFSMADNQRSIPSLVDGFKPGQRKILYTCFRKNLKKDMKVVELSGAVTGLTAYAYGDTSLQQTIVGLAQNFVGSNNINTLEPSGNFGSRLQGGNDAASARYIYTRLSPFARKVFNPADEPLLTYNTDDGKTIEPEVYVPVIPLVLVNGADGIGTGWSSSIPNYKPEDIIENLKLRMQGDSKEDMKPMTPWFRGWNGTVESTGEFQYKFTGTIRQISDTEVEITELPVRTWTQDYKGWLEDIIKAEKVPSFIKDYSEYNKPETVRFIIKMEEKHMQAALAKGLEETFKLTKTMATSNLVAFDGQGRIHKYATVSDIMEEFYHIRLRFYEKRKQYQLDEMQKELDKMTNQARFIKMIIDGKLVVARKKKAALVQELKRLDFRPFPKIVDARKDGENEPVVDADEEPDAEIAAAASDYDYLLGMAIWSLTQERIDRLLKQIGDKEMEIDALIKLTPKDIWNRDLDDLLAEWHFQLEDEAKRMKKLTSSGGRRASAKLGINGKITKRKGGDDEYSDSDFGPKKKKVASRPAAVPKPKPSSLMEYLKRPPGMDKPAEPPLLNSIEQQPVARPPAELEIVDLDGTVERQASEVPAMRKAAAKKKKVISDDEDKDMDDVDDVFMAVAKEAKANPAPARTGRAAARKPVKYTAESDDSDNDSGNDMLGDVSMMVKGIGKSTDSAPNGPTLFKETNRPTSGHGLTNSLIKGKKLSADLSDGFDDTDYNKLIPKDSPVKQAAKSARDHVVSDNEDDSMDIDVVAPPPKPKPAPAAVKPRGRPPGSTNGLPKIKAAAKPKEKPAPAPAVKKLAPLSPAAKAYAAKQAKTKAAAVAKPAPKKRVVDSDDDMEDDDMDQIANEILSDEVEDDVPIRPKSKAAAPAPAARRGRAARAATAKKPAYTVDLGSESEEESFQDAESEQDFDEDSE